MIKQGKLRGDRMLYKDGTVSRCIWYPLSEEQDDIGMCFDLLDEDANDLIDLLHQLSNEPPEKCPEEEIPEPTFTSIRWRIKPLGWLCGKIHDFGWWLAGI